MSLVLNDSDRLLKLAQLKKAIVAMYGSGLLTTPLNTETVHTIFKDDSEEEKARKNAENKEIYAKRAAELKQREPELIQELERIIERIKVARSDYGAIDNLYASSTAAVSTQQFVCEQCGNRDLNNIIQDNLRGDSICNGKDNQGCGYVITDHTVDMGAEKRNFEGEEDRNHFGAAPNKLMPDVVNLETNLNILVNGREKSDWKRLSQAQQNVEMNLSKIGKEEKHTREGYKTQQKRKAFKLMEEIAGNINIHQLVVQRAKEEFTKYRDIRDALHQFEGVVSACLVMAYEELSATMTLDIVVKSASITQDIGGATESKFGIILPHAEVKVDPAISTVPEVTLAKFNLEQVKEWLQAVAKIENTSTHASADKSVEIEFATVLGDHVSNIVNGGGVTVKVGATGRRNSVLDTTSNNIFGTTTISNRLNRYKEGSTAMNGNGSSGIGIKRAMGSEETQKTLTPGQILLRCHVMTIFQQYNTNRKPSMLSTPLLSAVTSLYREALSRRTSYDSVKAEADRVAGLQAKRLKIEEAPGLISRKINQHIGTADEPPLDDTWSSASVSKTIPSVNGSDVMPVEVKSEELEFNLEDLVGGPVLAASSIMNTNSSVKTSKPVARSSLGGNVNSGSHHPLESSKLHAPTVNNSNAAGSHSNSNNAASHPAVAVKTEDNVKKIGMKPRPKIVIK